MTSATVDKLCELITQSLIAWRLTGSARRTRDGAILVSCDKHEIRIQPAPPDSPFRWMVIIGGRRRGAISLVAVLRQVRGTLDPGYATMRLRVVAFPLVPP